MRNDCVPRCTVWKQRTPRLVCLLLFAQFWPMPSASSACRPIVQFTIAWAFLFKMLVQASIRLVWLVQSQDRPYFSEYIHEHQLPLARHYHSCPAWCAFVWDAFLDLVNVIPIEGVTNGLRCEMRKLLGPRSQTEPALARVATNWVTAASKRLGVQRIWRQAPEYAGQPEHSSASCQWSLSSTAWPLRLANGALHDAPLLVDPATTPSVSAPKPPTAIFWAQPLQRRGSLSPWRHVGASWR